MPIPEVQKNKQGMEKSYTSISNSLSRFGVMLPPHLRERNMHLDPDFEHLTYGDEGCKGCRIWKDKDEHDFLVFYAALSDIDSNEKSLVYAIVGFYWIEEIVKAAEVLPERHDENAHTRRIQPSEHEIVVWAKQKESGRLKKCIPIGSYRPNCDNPQGCYQYRVERELLKEWGGLSVKDGWLQRSAYIPELKDAERFLKWFRQYRPKLISQNN